MIKKSIVGAVLAFSASFAQAELILDHTVDTNVSVIWTGTGGKNIMQPVTFFGAPGNTVSFFLPRSGLINFRIQDIWVRGDAYELRLNGTVLTPTFGNVGPDTRGPGATSYFSAFFNDIALPSGKSTFSLFLTDGCCSVASNTASFSAVRLNNLPEPAPVPEPASLALTGAGLLGLLGLRRKALQAKK